MKFEVNVRKKYFFILLGAILILAGAIYGYAQNPAVFGHSGEEIEVIIDGEPKLLNDALADLNLADLNLPDADYDSGWVTLAGGNNNVILNHNLGTSIFKNVMIYGSCGSDTSKPILADGISSSGTGGYGYGLSFLTENSVTVETYFHGGMYTHECFGIGNPPQGSTHFRLMIWK